MDFLGVIDSVDALSVEPIDFWWEVCGLYERDVCLGLG